MTTPYKSLHFWKPLGLRFLPELVDREAPSLRYTNFFGHIPWFILNDANERTTCTRGCSRCLSDFSMTKSLHLSSCQHSAYVKRHLKFNNLPDSGLVTVIHLNLSRPGKNQRKRQHKLHFKAAKWPPMLHVCVSPATFIVIQVLCSYLYFCFFCFCVLHWIVLCEKFLLYVVPTFWLVPRSLIRRV